VNEEDCRYFVDGICPMYENLFYAGITVEDLGLIKKMIDEKEKMMMTPGQRNASRRRLMKKEKGMQNSRENKICSRNPTIREVVTEEKFQLSLGRSCLYNSTFENVGRVV
jgi:hypothetical protein